MSNLPLQPLVWFECEYSAGISNDAQGAGVYYRIVEKDNKHTVYWMDEMGGSDGDKEFKSLSDAQNWVDTDHYPHKMQPYVKPMQTWISVDDKLPKMYKRVLIKADCYLVAGREPKSEHNKDWGISRDWMWTIVNDSWVDSHMVTHWMPIPEFSTMQNNKGE